MSRLIKKTRSFNRVIGLFIIVFAAIVVGINAFAATDANEHIPVFTENGVAIRGTSGYCRSEERQYYDHQCS